MMMRYCLNVALTVTLIAFAVWTAANLKNRSSLSHLIQNTENAIATESPSEPTMQQLALACKFISEGGLEMDLEFCQTLTDAGGNVERSFTSMPSEIGFLTQLTSFHIDSNMLTGTLPSTLGNLVNLKYLSISRNKFTGTIPSTLGKLVQLTHLQMNSNPFTGTVPSSFGNLVQLTSLYLFDSPELRGTIPSTLCESSPDGPEKLIVIDCQNIECSCCQPFGFRKRCCTWCFWWKITRIIHKRKSKTLYSS